MATVTSNSNTLRHVAAATWFLAVAWLAPTAARATPIDVGVAPLYVGHEVTVQGLVTAAERDGYIVRLRLGEPPGSMSVQLVLGMLSRFPANPEAHYLGKEVRVYGRVSEFRGNTEMIVREPDHIVLASEVGAPVNAEEYEVLQNRVRVLEERLQELQGASATPTPPAD